jgi:segregation and condensation protein B
MTSGFADGDGDRAAAEGGEAGTGAVSGAEGYGHGAIDGGVADGTIDDATGPDATSPDATGREAMDDDAIDRDAIDRDAIDDDPVDDDGVGDQPLVGGVAAGTGGEVGEEAEIEESEIEESEIEESEIDEVDGPGVRACLEAILLVADEPVPEVLLAQVLERPRGEIDAALRALAAEYAADGRGFDLREIAGGWRFYTREDCAPLVERFVRDGQEVRLTQAALETLAVIAYRQPVSRARVSAVRGVNCDGVIRTLVLRGLVEDSGTDQETGAILYRTTGYFLERLGMASLDELPDLAPFLPENIEDIEDNERTRA